MSRSPNRTESSFNDQIVAVVTNSPDGPVAQPILDPKATAITLQATTADEGDVILIERFANGRWSTVGDPLARSGSVRAEIHLIAAKRGLSAAFPAQVRDEAQRWTREPGLGASELDDLSHLPFITIDNDDSKDLDQAMHIESRGELYTILYALADASHFVRSGTSLFDEAVARGASFYLPGLTLPMLPRVLSENLISLNQGQERRSLVMEMTLDSNGEIQSSRLVRARVRSVRKLTYRQVQRFYDDPWGSALTGQSFTGTLELLRTVGRLRLANARRRHVVRYNRHEVRLHIDEKTATGMNAVVRPRLDVERYNEQVSLLCNVEGARFLTRHRGAEHMQPIFRVHPAPPDVRLNRFQAQIEAVARHRQLDFELWRWKRDEREPLDAYLERLPKGRSWQRRRAAISRQALLTNERSLFGDEPGSHHGIGADVYARFSAPMREIVGIFTHKEAIEALADPESSPPPEQDSIQRDLVVKAGNRSKSLQKRLTKDVLAIYLNRLFTPELTLDESERPWRSGTVIGFKSNLAYVLLDEPPVEVKLYRRDLEVESSASYRVDDLGTAMEPTDGAEGERLVLGDGLDLQLRGRSKRHWLFTIKQR